MKLQDLAIFAIAIWRLAPRIRKAAALLSSADELTLQAKVELIERESAEGLDELIQALEDGALEGLTNDMPADFR